MSRVLYPFVNGIRSKFYVNEGADGYIAFFTGPAGIAGDNDIFWDRANNRLGIHTTTPNEFLTVNGVISLSEGVSPVNTVGYGKLFIKTSDSDLYFMDSSGAEFNLLDTGAGDIDGGSFYDEYNNTSDIDAGTF